MHPRSPGVVALVLAALAGPIGCNALLGNAAGVDADNATVDAGESSGSGGVGGSSGAQSSGSTSGASSSSGASSGSLEVDPSVVDIACDPDEVPPAGALYVSTQGHNDNEGTSPEQPLGSIEAAITKALNTLGQDTTIVVAEGTYPFTTTLPLTQPGLSIRGGWVPLDAGWRLNCDSGGAARTMLRSSASTAMLVAMDPAQRVSLERLSIEAANGSGDLNSTVVVSSSYGVFVRSGSVKLHGVIVRAGEGADGLPGGVDPPLPGTPPCDTGSTTAPVTGSPGDDGPDAPSPGSYSEAGFSPRDGGNGTAGALGAHGMPGGAGYIEDRCAFCVENGPSCTAVDPGTSGLQPVVFESITYGQGERGCGGRGGNGARGGSGGGASVAVFAGTRAKLELDGVLLVTAGGGDGGPRTPAQLGGSGSAGKPAQIDCAPAMQGCQVNNGACEPAGQSRTFTATNAGGTGQRGQPGGTGGAGAGGDSVGLVVFGAAGANRVSRERVSYQIGPSGAGGAVDVVSGRHNQMHEQVHAP